MSDATNEDLDANLHKAAMKFLKENFNEPTPNDFMIVKNAMRLGAITHAEHQIKMLSKGKPK